MKKSIMVSVAAMSAVLMGLTGCAKKDGASAKKDAGKAVTLKVWESNQGPDEFIKQAGEAYKKTHPNVTVEYINVELGDAAGQIALDGPSGAGPDIFAAPHDKLGELVNGGHIKETVNADALKGSVLGACSQALTYDGKMYGYPVSAETYALFYNKDLISDNDVPKTWDDLVSWVGKFNKENEGKRGFIMDVGNAYYTIVFTTSEGNRLFGPSGTDTKNSNVNSNASVKGMKFFQSLRSVLDIPAADLTTAYCDGAFQSGEVAMHITGLWNVKNFEDAGLNFGVAPLPALPGDTKPCASFSGTRAMFVSEYSENPEVAADFAAFLVSPEMQQLRFDLTGAMPSIETPVNSKYIPGFLKQLDYAFPMPSIPPMASYWEAMGNACKNIWDGADVQSELDACNSTIVGL